MIMNKFLMKITAVLCLCSLLIGGCQGSGAEAIVKINGREIYQPEFMVYLYEATQDFKRIGGNDIWETDFDGQSAEELVKERAMNTLQTVVVTGEKAKRYQVSLTEEDHKEAKEKGEIEWGNMTEEERKQIGISQEELYDIMEESILYEKVYDAATEDFQLSEADFKAYLQRNRENFEEKYTKFILERIQVADRETAVEVVQKWKAGEAFELLYRQYHTGGDDGTLGHMESYKIQLESLFDADFQLTQGEISEPLRTPEGYSIIRVQEEIKPTQSEVEDVAREEYILQMKKQLFNDALQQWLSEAKIEKNTELLDKIEMLQ